MTETQKQAVDFVRYVLEQLCEQKSEIKIEIEEKEHEKVLLLTVAGTDMGRAIGKEGQTVTALRTLVKIIGARGGEKLYLKIKDSE